MRRFSLWLRGKPFVADSLLAGILFVFDAIAFVGNSEMRSWPLYILVAVAVSVPVAWRRRHPRIVAGSVLTASLFSSLAGMGVGESTNLHPSLLALPIMLYTLVVYVGRRDAAIYLVALTGDAIVGLLAFGQEPISTVLFTVLMYSLAWVAAEFLGARRAYDEAVEARLAVAEYDRDRRAEEAVAMERTRIARELHDVIAHGVSVMVVQADGASYAIRKDPDRAEQAVANISATGRQALAELRRTVALLRTNPYVDDMPLYGTAGLAKVVDMMSRAGLNVEIEQTGNLDDISPAISLGIHRLVQESLTNVLRHGGHAPKARVSVVRRAEDVLVEIVNNGVGVSTSTVQGTGNGLLGMRERVAVLQGTLEAGSADDGHWRVRAELPLE
ncbi:MAG: histidine kinase [Rhodococcus sp. (in: high G+C Gram-positive bacteria)]|jgi:signal transduction histidine kinase|uniref:sensor histidine kinase n=1 Tax=Rhodococcus sp. EPR-157 TaxID=1813677 RepID=UPI0007BB4AA6|nr:histidine kinase [Rhodococcus sp. EPR-157]KZF01594.1 histidine kinase [Rhodococcus sp. EPR-157]